ncbi:MAG: thermonuclease family protein [Methylophagaceae bacterium]
MFIVSVLVITHLFTSVGHTDIIHGKVISIIDGDTFTVLTSSNQQVKIRLSGIDAPEKSQPFGSKAKHFLSLLTYNKNVRVDVETKDRYGRSVCDVYASNRNVNAELVKNGMAWVYRKYTNDQTLISLEDEARESRTGLWAVEYPMAPWMWRKGSRTKIDNAPTTVSTIIVGNKSSMIYHLSICPSYSYVHQNNRVLFTSESDASEKGYQRAGNCP